MAVAQAAVLVAEELEEVAEVATLGDVVAHVLGGPAPPPWDAPKRCCSPIRFTDR